jgi:hypothetical protein
LAKLKRQHRVVLRVERGELAVAIAARIGELRLPGRAGRRQLLGAKIRVQRFSRQCSIRPARQYRAYGHRLVFIIGRVADGNVTRAARREQVVFGLLHVDALDLHLAVVLQSQADGVEQRQRERLRFVHADARRDQ